MTAASASSVTEDPQLQPAVGGTRNRVFEIATSILIAVGFFFLTRATPDIPNGTDGYRHVRQAWRMIREPKAMFADPWHLAYFWPRPVDPWFGFHLLLTPFVLIFEPITAIKLFSAIVFGLTAYVLFLLLEQVQAKYRAAWVVLAMIGSSMTLARATSARPFLLSLLLTLLAALFTLTGKPMKLAVVAMIHALSYSIFFLVGIGPAIWFLLRRDRKSGLAVLYCVAGIAAGLLLNPYFPENVKFDVLQSSAVTIARAAHVRIAPELSPATWWAIAACLPAALPWIGALFMRISKRRSIAPGRVTDFFLLLSLITCIETVHIVRTADFFIPFAILFAAAVLSPYLKASRTDAVVVGLLLGIPCAMNVYLTYQVVLAAPSLERFQGAAAYLKTNAPGAMVLNTEWAPDYFFLFYLNPRSRYIIGIEPTFTYLSDPRKYWLWRHVFEDEAGTCDHRFCGDGERIDMITAARAEFGAQYVVTDHKNNPVLEGIFQRSAEVKEVYRDTGLSVYQIASLGR